MIENWMRIADDKGYVRPTYYQGLYNLYYRHHENSIFPVLRKYNMHFTAFRYVNPIIRRSQERLTLIYHPTSPLAGGFLTGKLSKDATLEARVGTRFEDGTPGAKAFGLWYDKPTMYSGNDKLRELGEGYGLSMAEMALRWVYYHSILRNGDGVIIGASKVAQLEAGLANIQQGPLPDSLADELDNLWHVVEPSA